VTSRAAEAGAKKLHIFYLSVTLLNDIACERDFVIKAIEDRNDFDIVG